MPGAAGGWEQDYALVSSDEEAAFAAAGAEGRAPVKRVRLTDLYSDNRVATEPMQRQVLRRTVSQLLTLHSHYAPCFPTCGTRRQDDTLQIQTMVPLWSDPSNV